MRITAVERMLVNAGHRPRAGRHMRRVPGCWSFSEVCKVSTDDGLVGWGETIPSYTWGSPNVTDQAIERVMGRSPAELLWDDSLGAGLQQALFDVTGKALDVPAYRLFGEKVRDWCPIAWWCVDMPPEDWAAEAEEAVASGYTAFKLKARPWFDPVRQIQAVSRSTPEHATFDLDFNSWLLDPGSAAPVLEQLERFDKVRIFETPIPQTDVGGNKSLRARLTRPIAMHFGTPPFLTAVREGVCDGFVIGQGAQSNRNQTWLAAEANMPCWLQLVGTGITTAFAAHQCAAFTAARWPTVTCLNTYVDDLLAAPLRIERGYVRVPEAPGLGIEIDEGALERLPASDPGPQPAERSIYTISWSDGRTAEYTEVDRYQQDFLLGNHPVFEPGVHFTFVEDDRSAEFDDRYRRVSAAGCPVTNPPVRPRLVS